ncbi:Serine/threonine protein kinase [Invertebrate iridescent virus 22]|uniref:Serine/threonine protein kinase n=1 Tax=Invertebrate iridescent virus 22 TaxID=345198 RepID=W8W1Z3_9VIRU|nr:Serine/threonine protein kinase [Invertebrate iridescent virus 22]CCV01931.1 Serine/threonine protein kinase [Invertebrate iridescent virus 22]
MTQTKTLLKYVDNPKLLGYGSFGNVYGASIPKSKISVAVKEGRISAAELRKALVKQYPMEYLFNKLINDLIDNKICPNFSYTYAIFFCDKCTLNEFDVKPIKTQCSETIVELFDFTLNKLENFDDEVILSILFQMLYAVASIQIEYGMFHNDIKKENILVKVIPSGGYWEYHIGNDVYQVPNHGYLIALNDFGVSHSFKPGFSIKDYGRRQAEVVYTNNKYRFKPFTTQWFPSVSKTGSVSRVKSHSLGGPRSGLTWNHFYKNFDSIPSIQVNLEDMVKFPAYYFHYDVLDTIYTFIGGKRTLQPGDHYPMKVSNKIKKLLSDFYLVKANSVWPEDRVDLFLAHHTIAKLFSSYRQSKLNGLKIEEYYLNV